MARVKTVPTPRNSALSAAMRRPQPSLSPSSSTVTVETETTTTSKVPVTRPQAVKPAKSLPPTRVKDVRSSSTSSQKRKSPTEDLTSNSQIGTSTTKVAVRSGRNTSAIDQSTANNATDDNTGPPPKRQKVADKVVEPTRRSSRNIKPTTNGHYNESADVKKTSNTKQKEPTPAKSKISVKLNSKSKQDKDKPNSDISKIVTNGDPKLDSTTVLGTSPPPAQSTRARTRTSTADVATPASVSAPKNQADSNTEQGPTDNNKIQKPRRYSYTSNDIAHDGSDAVIKLPESETSPDWDSTGLPVHQNGVPDPKLLMGPLVDFKHIHPNARVDATTGLVLDPAMVATNKHAPQAVSTPVINANATSAQSATQSPDYEHSHASSPSPISSADEFSTGQRASSTKNSKVKAKSSANKSKTPTSANNRGKNVANTYPRKQPFKAQIEYPNYPPSDAAVPDNYSMWEICQNYPNSLRENNLLAFVQREWSANELCACLKEDVKEILYARPGKDKTMVYQKRMERIKKDLVAKDEYQNLLNAPKLREDGRPSWVKRGNVRRK